MSLPWDIHDPVKVNPGRVTVFNYESFFSSLKSTVMELFGRVTANATVTEIKDGRKVVNFSMAINDGYKPKGSDEFRKITTFVNCSYWLNPALAEHLTKGTMVELYGHMSVHAWTSAEGEAKGSLNFHAYNIKLHGRPKAGNPTESSEFKTVSAAEITEPVGDLPF